MTAAGADLIPGPWPAEVASRAIRPGAPARAPGQLGVTFAVDPAGRTYLGAQRSTHPFHLCRALYRPDDPPGLCTLYVQGCSGGLFERDRVALTFSVGAGAAAHVTTAAATIVHRMPRGDHAEQLVELEVAPGGWLEHAPEPLILFPGSRLVTRTRVRVATGGRAIVMDGFLGHRLPDDTRPFEWLDAETRVLDANAGSGADPLARERFFAAGADWQAGGCGRMGRYRCQGTVLVLGAGDQPLGALRAALASAAGGGAPTYGGASSLPNGAGVMARVLATDGTALRAALDGCWSAARAALGLPPGQRRPR